MKKLIYIVSLFFLGLSIASCQKVIDVDLNSTDPKIVIEANLSDQPGPYEVKLTQSVNFDEPNQFPPVMGAVVKLSDDAGNSETLTETFPGIYNTSTITGVPGRTYTLQVTSNNKTYTSVARMAPPVTIDSVNLKKGLFRETRNIHLYFTDPVGVENWYRIVHYVNDDLRNTLDYTEDILRDGQNIEAMLFVGDGEDTLKNGDSVTVFLRTIDKGSYDYFRTVTNADGAGDPGATPANPVSTFNNGALGYFSVYAETRKYLIVK